MYNTFVQCTYVCSLYAVQILLGLDLLELDGATCSSPLDLTQVFILLSPAAFDLHHITFIVIDEYSVCIESVQRVYILYQTAINL